jgi:hypothetical protein
MKCGIEVTQPEVTKTSYVSLYRTLYYKIRQASEYDVSTGADRIISTGATRKYAYKITFNPFTIIMDHT